jgi:hypothetical protein
MHDSIDDTLPPRRTNRLQFSLAALLIFVSVACLFLAWIARPRPRQVTTLVQVSSQTLPPANVAPRFSRLVGDQAETGRSWDVVQRTQLAILKSRALIQAVIEDPKIAKLPLIRGLSDPSDWLGNLLSAEFIQNSEILSLSLTVPETQAKQAAQVLDAVVVAYLTMAASEESRHTNQMIESRKRECDAMVAQIQDLSNEIAERTRHRGSDDPEARLLQLKADRLLRLADELSIDVELLESSGALPRARQIQRATVH